MDRGAMFKKPELSKDVLKTFAYPIDRNVQSQKPKDILFFSNLKPIFVSMRLMGTFPYVLTKNKDLASPSLCSKWIIYSFLMISLQIALAIYNVSWIIHWLVNQNLKLDSVLRAGLSLLHLVIVLDKPFCSFAETKRIISYINDWRLLQVSYVRAIGQPMTKCIKYAPYIFISVTVVYTSLCIYFVVIRLFVLRSLVDIVVYIFVFIHMVIRILFWTFSNYFIWRTGKYIKEYTLKVIAEEKGQLRSKKIAELRSLWLLLSQQTSNLGWVIGMTVSVQTLASVVSLVIGMYAVVVWILDTPSLSNAPPSIFLTASEYIMLLFICEITHRTSNMVGTGFMKSLLSIPKTNLDHDTNLEIHTFCLAISSQPPIVTISKYVNVDRTLWTKFLTTVVTYMIFLGQVRSSEEEEENS